ncbi:hypothetical protein FRB93_007300 [Tulasnella sp. JGI-2019a]|nr:hypothetical protein FRB93_007300 [Tulasnella sp. JGI-2019a]
MSIIYGDVENCDSLRAEVKSCEAEVVRMLQRLLLTSATREQVNPTDLVTTARLSLRVSTITGKERLLQGTLYSIFSGVLRSWQNDGLEVGSRHALLQKGQVMGSLLTSTLRLYIWLHPSVASGQPWLTFESFLRLLVTGSNPAIQWVPGNPPEAWDTVVELAGDDNYPRQYSRLGLGVLWFASRIVSGPEGSQKIEEGRLLDWFTAVMRKEQEDRWVVNVPTELRSYWTTVERRCAGILFLETGVQG